MMANTHICMYIYMCVLQVVDRVDDGKYTHSWEILASQKSFVVYADSAQEKREWLHDLQLALDEACVVLQCVAVYRSVLQCVCR